jgi:hypothetical protein
MNSRLSRMILPVGLVLALAAANGQSSSADLNDPTGSWLFTLNRTLPSQQQVLSLGTFSREGTFIGTAQGDGIVAACCPTEGPAHGAWTKTGHNTFTLTFNALWYRADSTLVGILKLNMSLTLDEKSQRLSGLFRGAVIDPSGNVVFPMEGSLTAERIVVQ